MGCSVLCRGPRTSGVAEWHDTDTPGVYERFTSAKVRMTLVVQE